VYKGWMKVAKAMNSAVNAAILTLAFFLAVLPVGLMLRLKRRAKPTLPWRGDPEAHTYWVPRTEPAQRPRQFLKRY
jgi:hypothetical protein